MYSFWCFVGSLLASPVLGQVILPIQQDCLKLPSMKDPSECCNLEKLVEESIFNDCVGKFGHAIPKLTDPITGQLPIDVPNEIPNGSCLSECLLNGTHILNVENKIDQEIAIRSLTAQISSELDYISVVKSGIEICNNLVLSKSNEFAEIIKLPPPPNGMRICNPLSGFFIGCLHSHLFRNCPPKRWTTNAECDALKDHFNKCPLPFPIRPDRI